MATLFQILLGEDFECLPPLVRRLHARADRRVYRGASQVSRGSGTLSRVIGAAASLPPACADADIEVIIEPHDDGERWTRNFARARMRSHLWARNGLLRERLGVTTFDFTLSVEGAVLVWRVARVRGLGMPLPARLFRGVVAREFEQDGRYRFDVRAELPILGLLVHYHGWLDVD